MVAGDSADLGVIPVAELGSWADRDELAAVPAGLRAADHVYQWSGLLPAYRENLIEWAGQARAIPLAGDGSLLVYRADRLADPQFIAAFRKQVGHDPVVPATWEEFAILASLFTEFDKKPSLSPMTGPETAELFFRVAACYDRQAATDAIAKAGTGFSQVSFLHDVASGAFRLDSPSFKAAADWLGKLPKPTPGPSDPPVALGKGDTMLAVLSLAQLARLPRENGRISARFGIAPLPGSRQYFDPEKKQLVPAGSPNYVPYFSGGRLGVVRSRCPNPEAAFDLLAEIGSPTRSLELLSTPGLGVGPFRNAHLERDRLSAWLGYGFDADRSKSLQEAMRQYVRPEIRNPVYGLRGPDQGPLNAAASDELTKITNGTVTPDAGLTQLIAAWNRIDEKAPKETRLRWRKVAAGLN
ncbi:MAG: hypothetical protein C0467_19490 [Planctomycetaceae bacterium]|nr:hypothetical protein [Planctomycetaceae bacterium]